MRFEAFHVGRRNKAACGCPLIVLEKVGERSFAACCGGDSAPVHVLLPDAGRYLADVETGAL